MVEKKDHLNKSKKMKSSREMVEKIRNVFFLAERLLLSLTYEPYVILLLVQFFVINKFKGRVGKMRHSHLLFVTLVLLIFFFGKLYF